MSADGKLSFGLKVENPRLTTFESLRIALSLTNGGPSAVELPSLYDRAGVIRIRLRDPDGATLRVMDGLAGQLMMSTSAPDAEVAILTLAAGETWTAGVDLGRLHHLFPAGRFLLDARYADAEVDLVSDDVLIEVLDLEPEAVRACAEVSMMRSLITLAAATGPEGRRFYLRQQPLARPLASWCATEIKEARGAEAAAVSLAIHNWATVVDAAFERFVVWRSTAGLKARLYYMGRPSGPERTADLPPGGELLPWADHDLDGQLFIYIRTGDALAVYAFGEAGLELRLQAPAPPGPIRVRGSEAGIEVVSAGPPLTYAKLAWDGQSVETRELHAPRFTRPMELNFEPKSGLVTALFAADKPSDGLEGVTVNLSSGRSTPVFWGPLPLSTSVTEAAFGIGGGGPQLLVAHDGILTHVAPGGAATALRYGPEPPDPSAPPQFFPHVVEDPKRAYLRLRQAGWGPRYLERTKGGEFRSYEGI